MKQKSLIVFVFSMLTSIPVSAMNYGYVHLTELQPTPQDALWSRIKQVPPAYPVEMAMKGAVGCGVFKISLDKDGKAESIDLLTSVPAAAEFKSAKKELKKWKWHNTTGKPDAPEQKILRLDYCMGGSTEAEAIQRCELQAKAECK
ncbi:energy transducer TonB [Rheinheimera sp. 1928-s]|uniref:energy transducer TonB n=1 Tax=Rheinheimera sp. 1928-s TaxID=3033803 RepID=UPI00260BC4A3|nr:energy transducer TonB [Rheinheimera sp. 1928-s]MDF3127265.1 energy transducer TonB [Rheinheimera sp. 1928-s]